MLEVQLVAPRDDDFPLEDESPMAEAALALVESDITGRIAYSQPL
jgi:hypothetical protein